jgi:hypothetical protein
MIASAAANCIGKQLVQQGLADRGRLSTPGEWPRVRRSQSSTAIGDGSDDRSVRGRTAQHSPAWIHPRYSSKRDTSTRAPLSSSAV